MKKGKSVSLSTSIKKRYSGDVRRFKEWCELMGIEYSQFEDAKADEICALSMNDYDIGERRYMIETNDNQYFLKQEDYEIFENSYC